MSPPAFLPGVGGNSCFGFQTCAPGFGDGKNYAMDSVFEALSDGPNHEISGADCCAHPEGEMSDGPSQPLVQYSNKVRFSDEVEYVEVPMAPTVWRKVRKINKGNQV